MSFESTRLGPNEPFYFWKCHTRIAQQTASQVANVVETGSVGRVLESGKWSMHGRRGVPFEDVPPHPRNKVFFLPGAATCYGCQKSWALLCGTWWERQHSQLHWWVWKWQEFNWGKKLKQPNKLTGSTWGAPRFEGIHKPKLNPPMWQPHVSRGFSQNLPWSYHFMAVFNKPFPQWAWWSSSTTFVLMSITLNFTPSIRSSSLTEFFAKVRCFTSSWSCGHPTLPASIWEIQLGFWGRKRYFADTLLPVERRINQSKQ